MKSIRHCLFTLASMMALNACGPSEATVDSSDLSEELASCTVQPIQRVTASAAEEGNPATNAVDGDSSTRWSAFGKGQFITLDLGRELSACSTSIQWHQGNVRRSRFQISTSSDGQNFRSVYSGQSSGQTTSFERTPLGGASGRYIRVTVFGNTVNDWASVLELRVSGRMGSADAGTPPPPPPPPGDGGTGGGTDAGTTGPTDAGAPPTPAGEWPSASNTGVPSGTSLRASGGLTVSTTGAVIDGLDISGALVINASNVVVKNSRIRSSAFWTVTIKGSNVTLQDVEVDCLGTSGAEGSSGVVGGSARLLRVNIHGCENGYVPGSGSELRDSYLHHMSARGAPHFDGIQIDGGLSNVQVVHNTVDMTNVTQTSAVMIDNAFGPARDITVAQNKLMGAGYTVYADGQFSSTDVVSGITFSDNVMGKGYYGYALIRNASVTWTNNRDVTTGTIISR